MSGLQATLRAREIAIVVSPYDTLGAALAGRDLSHELGSVEAYVDELLAGLSIPATCTVEVKPDERRRDSLRPVRVRIDGEPCAQPVVVDQQAVSLPEQVRQIVCDNRDLFVSPRFSRDCRRAWVLHDELAFAASPNTFLRDLLTRLVRRGFSINRARAWLRSREEEVPTTADAAFEEAAALGEPLPIRVSASGGRGHDVAEEVRWRVGAQWGIDAAVTSVSEELPVGIACRVRVNDLLLPDVRKRRLRGQSLADAVVHGLRPHLGCLVTMATAGAMVSRVAERHPLLEQEVARRFDRPALTAVMRELADQQVPMGDARGILETLSAINLHLPAGVEREHLVFPPETATVCRVRDGGSPSTEELCQTIRAAVGRQILELHGHDGTLSAIVIDWPLEDRLASGSVEGHDLRRIERVLSDTLSVHPDVRLALLVGAAARPSIEKVTGSAFPRLPVVAYQELPSDTNVQVVARLGDPEASPAEEALHDELAAVDLGIDEELVEERTQTGISDDPMLAELLLLGRHVRRVNARTARLETAVSAEAREYLTADLELVDAELERLSHGGGDAVEDVGDLLSDYIRFREPDE